MLEQFDDDMDFVSYLIKGFIQNVESQLPRIQQAIDNQDAALLFREAHTIKGGAATIAAEPLTARATDLEKIAHVSQMEDAENFFLLCKEEFFRLKKFADGL